MARIAALEELIEYCNKDVLDGYSDTEWVKQIAQDALALLKEQKQTIEDLKEKLRLLDYGNHYPMQDILMPAT